MSPFSESIKTGYKNTKRRNYLYLRFLAASDFFFLFTLGFS